MRSINHRWLSIVGAGCAGLLLWGKAMGAPQAQGRAAQSPQSESTLEGDAVRQPDGERKVRLDIVVCVDSTGSMQDEIDVVKQKLKAMVNKIANGDPKPVVRFGVVTYRDRGDEYITKKFPLTDDIPKVNQDIDSIYADGGGDGPESVNEALHVAVEGMNWDTKPGVSRLIFLIGDAAPHLDYPDDYNYHDEIVAAITRHIVIHTIGCSGLEEYGPATVENSGIGIFKEIALRTEGRFDYISYLAEAVDAKGKTHDVIYEGGKPYVLAARDKARWREGGERLAGEGAAKLMDARLRLSGGVSRKVNNLEVLLTRTSQSLTQKRGVVYETIEARPLRGQTIAHGLTSGIRHEMQKVINTQAAWQSLWLEHSVAFPSAPAMPAVDFSHHTVIAVALDEKSAAGKLVQITGVEQRADAAIIRYQTALRAGIQDSKTLTQPHHIIIVPKLHGAVKFVREAEPTLINAGV